MWWNKKSDYKLTEASIEEQLHRIVSLFMPGIKKQLESITDIPKLNAEVVRLTKELSELTIKKSQKEEEFARERREIEHKVGLVRIQQTAELEIEKGKLEIELGKKNLNSERSVFEERVKFNNERFELEVKYQRQLLGKMMERLPTAEIIAKFNSNGGE